MATKKKKLVRKTPSLKSQGAKYSTTKNGQTTYYKSSKDAPGYNDTNQSRSNMSKGGTPVSIVGSKNVPETSTAGLSQTQVQQLQNMPGIDQNALNNYVASGAAQGTNTPPNPGSKALTELSINPEDWAKSFMEGMQGQNPDTTGVGTQSTQGDAGVQPGVNDAVAGAMPQGTANQTGVGGTPGTTMAGEQALMTGGVPMATVAAGGYQKIGPAYFQRSSDGLRAVSDPSIISGLKHGTIPYSTGQLDGTTFSKSSVPLLPQGGGVPPPPGSSANEGADTNTTYENMRGKYGLTETQSNFFEDPMSTVQSMVEKIYTMSGVAEANDVIKDITGELEDLENDRDDEIADINDNPWLTEGVRLRQIQSVEGRYEDKIANRTNRLGLLEDVRNNAQQQAQFAIGTSISLWDKQRTFQQQQIDSWNEQAQRAFNNDMAMKNYNLNVLNSEADRANAKTSGNAKDWLLAKEYGYKGSFYDWLNPPKAGDGTDAPLGALNAVDQSLSQLTFLRETAAKALANAKDTSWLRTPVGPSIVSKLAGDTFIGNTSYRQAQNQSDTLKTNVLALMTDPSVKKFFGPQMSNADVRLMMSTGSTLNPGEQDPADYIQEIERLDDLFMRMQDAVTQGVILEQGGRMVDSPDGPVLIIPSR